jgi:fructosamine-3-kinase
MFGGIPKSFFEEYHKHMPKTEPVNQYELRGDLYELFHYLNHTVLFGVSEQWSMREIDRCRCFLTCREDTQAALNGRWKNCCAS